MQCKIVILLHHNTLVKELMWWVWMMKSLKGPPYRGCISTSGGTHVVIIWIPSHTRVWLREMRETVSSSYSGEYTCSIKRDVPGIIMVYMTLYWQTLHIIYYLIYSKCGVRDPSWAEISHFSKFLDIQLNSCENSMFCDETLVGDVMSGLKGFVVKFMIRMSQVKLFVYTLCIQKQNHPTTCRISQHPL